MIEPEEEIQCILVICVLETHSLVIAWCTTRCCYTLLHYIESDNYH